MTRRGARALIAGGVLTLALAGVLQHNETSDCRTLLPAEATGEEFNTWTASLPPFTNLEYTGGEWRADGRTIAYSATEDSDITTCRS